MAYFLIQPGQTLVSPVDARRFTADDKGIVQVSDDLQTQFHNMGATLWVEGPSINAEAEPAPAVVSDSPAGAPAKGAKGKKAGAPTEDTKAEA
jgi:hypothetical protein